MVAEAQPTYITVEEYLAVERISSERHEYVDGHMYLLAGGTTNHGLVAARFTALLTPRLAGQRCRVYPSDVRVRVQAHRYLYPDVSVSCDDRDAGDEEDIRFPRVIVEVLSPSTEAYDRGDKFALYRQCPSLEEYVLADPRRVRVEVYRRGEDGWTLHTFESGDEVRFASLNVSFAIEDLYRDIHVKGDGSREP